MISAEMFDTRAIDYAYDAGADAFHDCKKRSGIDGTQNAALTRFCWAHSGYYKQCPLDLLNAWCDGWRDELTNEPQQD